MTPINSRMNNKLFRNNSYFGKLQNLGKSQNSNMLTTTRAEKLWRSVLHILENLEYGIDIFQKAWNGNPGFSVHLKELKQLKVTFIWRNLTNWKFFRFSIKGIPPTHPFRFPLCISRAITFIKGRIGFRVQGGLGVSFYENLLNRWLQGLRTYYRIEISLVDWKVEFTKGRKL